MSTLTQPIHPVIVPTNNVVTAPTRMIDHLWSELLGVKAGKFGYALSIIPTRILWKSTFITLP